MAEKLNIYSDAWCEIVFEDKNKEYGAFQLRKNSGYTHLRAMIIAILLVVLTIGIPLIVKSIIPKKKELITDVTNLANLKVEANNKPKDEEKVDLPPPPELKSSIKFTAPIIAADDKVADDDDLKTQDELIQSKLSISTADVIGKDDGTGVDIADLQEGQLDASDNKVEEQIFLVVEQQPEFIGSESLNAYLMANVKYPQLARESGIAGTVFVQFVVEANGAVSNITIARGIGGGCDEEALRVIKGMPHWKPGKQNGKAVRVKLSLPIKFDLR